MRFDVFEVMNVQITHLQDVTPYILVDKYQCFGETATCIFRGVSMLKLWDRQDLPPKHWYLPRKLCGITS